MKSPGRPDAWPPTAALLTLISASCARSIVRRTWKRQSDPRTPHLGCARKSCRQIETLHELELSQ
jgi:hypothetical protein